jgi:hypothetical protein
VRGKLVDGKAQVSDIRVIEGRGRPQTYSSVEKVPAGLRDQVKALVELSEKGIVTSKSKK